MKRSFAIVLFVITTISVSAISNPVNGQQDKVIRNQTREKLAALLEKVGPDIKVEFSQSKKLPYIYLGTLKTALVNTESLEISISVTAIQTIGFRIYPRYKNGYINVDKVNDRAALMRLLLRLSDRAFLFWGADESGDVFTGYTFTLESGFPEEAISVVLRSIAKSDKFVGEMRPILDAPIADVTVTTPAPPGAPDAKSSPAKAKVPPRNRRRGTN